MKPDKSAPKRRTPPPARPAPDEIANAARRAKEQWLMDNWAGQIAAGIADRVLFNQHFEDLFLRDCKTDAERNVKVAQLPAFCASVAWDVAEALARERARRRAAANPEPKF